MAKQNSLVSNNPRGGREGGQIPSKYLQLNIKDRVFGISDSDGSVVSNTAKRGLVLLRKAQLAGIDAL